MADIGAVVVGASGRMGRQLIQAVYDTEGMHLSGALEAPGHEFLGQDAGEIAGRGQLDIPISDDPATLLDKADVILDFTRPQVSVGLSKIAAGAGVAHVIGTTGFGGEEDEAIAEAARRTSIVKSGNMSLGVNLLGQLVRQAARSLDADFDIEIVEMHHRHKIDAPSGTAYLLGKEASSGRDVDLEAVSVRSRDGQTGARRRGDIGFATLRGGSVIGEHSVIFAAEGERITLSHQADDRSVFARGAIKAAQWAMGRSPGLYSMLDVLGLRD